MNEGQFNALGGVGYHAVYEARDAQQNKCHDLSWRVHNRVPSNFSKITKS
jgi:hypothetical protein